MTQNPQQLNSNEREQSALTEKSDNQLNIYSLYNQKMVNIQKKSMSLKKVTNDPLFIHLIQQNLDKNTDKGHIHKGVGNLQHKQWVWTWKQECYDIMDNPICHELYLW